MSSSDNPPDIMNVGVPHIKSKIKHARNNNYNLETILPEFIDFPIENTDKISITVNVNEKKLFNLSVSDNYNNGFENILEEDQKNPFNWGHERDGHENNDVISEYGTGMKQAMAACGTKNTVYTKLSTGDSYFIHNNLHEMSNRPDPIKSYSPTVFKKICDNDYKNYHEFDTGSTILIEEIRPEIYHSTTEDEIIQTIKQIITKSYNKLLIKKKDTLQIRVNGSLVTPLPEYFDIPQCIPFNIVRHILIKKGSDNKPILLEKNKISDTKFKYREYNGTTKQWRAISSAGDIRVYLDLPNYYSNGYMSDDGTMMTLKATGIMFIQHLSNVELPKGNTKIYKIDRYHGCYMDTNNSNGAKNYVYIELLLKSKELGKVLGATYKKTIDLNKTNDITEQLKANIKNLSSLLEYDTSTPKAERHYKTALKYGIDIPESKIPKKFRNSSAPDGNSSSDPEEEEPEPVNSPISDEEEEPEPAPAPANPPISDEEEEPEPAPAPVNSPISDEEEEPEPEPAPANPPLSEEEKEPEIRRIAEDKFNNEISDIKTKGDLFDVLNKIVISINTDADKKKQIMECDVDIDQSVISYVKYINQLINN